MRIAVAINARASSGARLLAGAEALGHPAVDIRRVRRVRLCAHSVVAYADGERIGPLTLTIDVDPGAVRILAQPHTGGRASVHAVNPRRASGRAV